MNHRTRAFAVAFAAALLLVGCMTRPPAPVIDRATIPSGRAAPTPAPAAQPAAEPDWRPPTYTVKRGDTLIQIALDHGLDYRDLVAWNNIDNPNVIRVGQELLLAPPGAPPSAGAAGAAGVTTAPLKTVPPVAGNGGEARPAPATATATGRANTATYKTEPKALKLPYSEQALAQLQRVPAPPQPATAVVAEAPAVVAPRPAPSVPVVPAPAKPESARVPELDRDEPVDWAWPTAGKVVAGFSDTANLKGIDIAGKAGQPVVSSAAGKVVYAGAGLRGYGKLIIVKHNKTYLSAYAHNKAILVKEGQLVAKGQQIAEMGDTDADQNKLHFEIRRLGKPMDPTKFLPPA